MSQPESDTPTPRPTTSAESLRENLLTHARLLRSGRLTLGDEPTAVLLESAAAALLASSAREQTRIVQYEITRREKAESQLAALREALTKQRWATHLCGACGDRYRLCRGCGVGTPGGILARVGQCGGHPTVPCAADCYIDAALSSSSEAPPAKEPRFDLCPLCGVVQPCFAHPLPAKETRCCMEPAPDRSGRTCDKPQGHDGDHWTYGGATLSWPMPAKETP